jgi:hypothetical protein
MPVLPAGRLRSSDTRPARRMAVALFAIESASVGTLAAYRPWQWAAWSACAASVGSSTGSSPGGDPCICCEDAAASPVQGSALGSSLVTPPPRSSGLAASARGCPVSSLSCVVPQIFSAAGNLDPAHTGAGLTRVSTLGYLGYVTGPVLIGAAGRTGRAGTRFADPAVARTGSRCGGRHRPAAVRGTGTDAPTSA